VVVVDEKVEAKVSPIRVDGILLAFEMQKAEQEKGKEKNPEEGGQEN
jgi:NADH-quinone oxidoreductase subunit E